MLQRFAAGFACSYSSFLSPQTNKTSSVYLYNIEDMTFQFTTLICSQLIQFVEIELPPIGGWCAFAWKKNNKPKQPQKTRETRTSKNRSRLGTKRIPLQFIELYCA
ncbi:unnamed protein product [Ectocarpus sp. 13 AM-2016]